MTRVKPSEVKVPIPEKVKHAISGIIIGGPCCIYCKRFGLKSENSVCPARERRKQERRKR